MRLRRHRLAHIPAPAAKPDPIAALLDRVLEEPGGEATEQAWLARQLEAAARAKETLTVTVRMPDGETVEYLLEPASVASGRLRARDRRPTSSARCRSRHRVGRARTRPGWVTARPERRRLDRYV